MNKEKFLKELEKRLSILNEKERKDIIEEYKDTIEEKIKNGEKEEDAVKDFGNMDDLVKDILEAYKINPKYNKESDFQKFINDGENIIKECADTLEKGVKDIAQKFKENNEEINLSLVFEIIIKVFITILLIGIIRIPFIIFTSIGNSLFKTFFSPFDPLIKVFWIIFLGIIYLVVIAIIISKIFKEYFVKKQNNDEKQVIKKNQTQKSTVKDNKKKQSNAQITSIIFILIKIFVIIFILIPLIGTNIGLLSATTVSIYYWIKGIDLFGLTLLLTGITIISIWLTHIITSILKEKHIKTYPLIIGIILIITGGIIFGISLTKIKYIDELPKETELETMTNTYVTDKRVYIETHNEKYISKKIDETLNDNIIKIRIKYPKQLYNMKINQTDNYTFDEESCKENKLCGTYNYFDINYDGEEIKNIKSAYNLFIENLKQKKIYNYDKAYSPVIEIYANEKTINLIEID